MATLRPCSEKLSLPKIPIPRTVIIFFLFRTRAYGRANLPMTFFEGRHRKHAKKPCLSQQGGPQSSERCNIIGLFCLLLRKNNGGGRNSAGVKELVELRGAKVTNQPLT